MWRISVCAWALSASLSWAANAGEPVPKSAPASFLDAVEFGGHLELSYEGQRNLDLDASEKVGSPGTELEFAL